MHMSINIHPFSNITCLTDMCVFSHLHLVPDACTCADVCRKTPCPNEINHLQAEFAVGQSPASFLAPVTGSKSFPYEEVDIDTDSCFYVYNYDCVDFSAFQAMRYDAINIECPSVGGSNMT